MSPPLHAWPTHPCGQDAGLRIAEVHALTQGQLMSRASGKGPLDCVPVLMYHDVGDTPGGRAFRKFVVPPKLFSEHLDALGEAHYGTGCISQLAHGVPAQRVVFVTFDDGFDTLVEHALPTLAEHDMTATLFLPSAFVGQRAAWMADLGEDHRRLLTWNDIRDAAAAGFEIGGHGHRHLELDVLDQHQLQQELVVSKDALEDETSAAVLSLAYPFGYHNRRVRLAAHRAGYIAACEVGYGLHRSDGDPLSVRRLLIGPDMSGERLLALMDEGKPTLEQRARQCGRPLWRMARRARTLARSPRRP